MKQRSEKRRILPLLLAIVLTAAYVIPAGSISAFALTGSVPEESPVGDVPAGDMPWYDSIDGGQQVL